ncbi:McrC family protein [Shewanella sp. SM32]|uniref:McrC family protein n=1 Tax=Shewanella sp. SM32 TaxID=2912796 RepID=UPI0021D8FEAF|nr:McrC family protein [Shewanella sp. SM32]MCU8071312.1 McrC family protein [Shewanella sp. SM32]
MVSNGKLISVFEFDFLCVELPSNGQARFRQISRQAFEYIKQLCLSKEAVQAAFKLRIQHQQEVLQAQNFAGVVITPDGTQIEILPKIGKQTECYTSDQGRMTLLWMLKRLKGFRHLQTNQANIKTQKMPLMELFISQFLTSVSILVKRGLRSGYQDNQGNLLFLKGKLSVSRQLRYNLVNRQRFAVDFDEFSVDRAENRLIHSALTIVAMYSRLASHQRLNKELRFSFEAVSLSSDYVKDFENVRLDRSIHSYEMPLAWAKIILEGLSPQSMLGTQQAFSLLFPMEAVFEAYVAAELKRQLLPTSKMTAQARSHWLVTHDSANWFRLKPDIVIDTTEACFVLDTKWKIFDQKDNNASAKYGVVTTDLYQMFAYGHTYLNGSGDMYLIYPMQFGFDKAVQLPLLYHSSSSSGETLRLWLVPFEINEKQGKLHLPRLHQQVATAFIANSSFDNIR